MKLTLLILTAFLLIAAEPGCERTNNTSLTGTWTWVKTVCCGRIRTISTPESSSSTVSLMLNADHTYKKYRNDELKEGSFQTRIGINDYAVETGDRRDVIVFDTESAAYYYFLKDTLVIDYGYMDLQTEYYLRKK